MIIPVPPLTIRFSKLPDGHPNPKGHGSYPMHPSVRLLASLCQDESPTGRQVRVKVLVEAGANVDATEDDGDTPLIQAARFGHTEAVTALVQAGASLDVTDNGGMGPRDWANLRGHTDVVQMLYRGCTRSQGRKVAGSQGRRVAGSQGRKVTGSQGRRVARLQGRKVASLAWPTHLT